MSSGFDEHTILLLLLDKDAEFGVFFARWDEIRSQNYSAEYLASIEGAPDLSESTQILLNDLVEQGYVRDLANWATHEGRHYAITFAGKQRLNELTQKQSFLRKIWNSNGRLIIPISAFFAFYMWVINNVDPNLACSMPLSSILEKCAIFLDEFGGE